MLLCLGPVCPEYQREQLKLRRLKRTLRRKERLAAIQRGIAAGRLDAAAAVEAAMQVQVPGLPDIDHYTLELETKATQLIGKSARAS